METSLMDLKLEHKVDNDLAATVYCGQRSLLFAAWQCASDN